MTGASGSSGTSPSTSRPDAADERAWPQYFRTDGVAGCPPDAYAATGQLWGNPLYRWDVLRDDGYLWWIERLRRTFALFDLVRLDHFRGFAAYWAIPAGDETALGGRWEQGPGRGVFDAANEALGALPLLAEDLGDIDQPVIELRKALGLPGMAVLQFGFEPAYEYNTHDLVNLEDDQVVYTGTHDNDTVVRLVVRRCPTTGVTWSAARGTVPGLRPDGDDEPSWAMIELALGTRCGLAMMQAQDVLGLGSEARMNAPGIEGGWSWQMTPGALTAGHAARLRALTEASGRLPS